MSAIEIYVACASTWFGFGGIIWNKSDYFNLFIKTTLICFALIGFFLTFQSMGYIVKT